MIALTGNEIVFRRSFSAPRTVRNMLVSNINATSAEVTWDRQEGPMLKIDMKYGILQSFLQDCPFYVSHSILEEV